MQTSSQYNLKSQARLNQIFLFNNQNFGIQESKFFNRQCKILKQSPLNFQIARNDSLKYNNAKQSLQMNLHKNKVIDKINKDEDSGIKNSYKNIFKFIPNQYQKFNKKIDNLQSDNQNQYKGFFQQKDVGISKMEIINSIFNWLMLSYFKLFILKIELFLLIYLILFLQFQNNPKYQLNKNDRLINSKQFFPFKIFQQENQEINQVQIKNIQQEKNTIVNYWDNKIKQKDKQIPEEEQNKFFSFLENQTLKEKIYYPSISSLYLIYQFNIEKFIDIQKDLGIDKNLAIFGDVSLLILISFLAYFPPPIITDKYDQKWPTNPFESLNLLLIPYYSGSFGALVFLQIYGDEFKQLQTNYGVNENIINAEILLFAFVLTYLFAVPPRSLFGMSDEKWPYNPFESLSLKEKSYYLELLATFFIVRLNDEKIIDLQVQAGIDDNIAKFDYAALLIIILYFIYFPPKFIKNNV